MDCSAGDVVGGCSVEEGMEIFPSIMSAMSATGDVAQQNTDDNNASNSNADINSSNPVEGQGPLESSPTSDTEDSSFMDAFPSSTAIINALSIYDGTSGTFSRTRGIQSIPSRFPSFMSVISSYDESNNQNRTRIRNSSASSSNLSASTPASRTSQLRPLTGSQIGGAKNEKVAQAGNQIGEETPQSFSTHHSLLDEKRKKLVQRTPLREVPLSPPDPLHRRSNSFTSKYSDAGSTHKILITRSYEVKEHYLESIFYVSTSAIIGSVCRTYFARIFGFDCESQEVKDFLTPLTSKICVTNGGRTEQTGGALFYDFPANVFGSFVMGLISSRLNERRARLPWLHKDHALQRDDVFHASLATGFCGCLTTFAAWSTQMVVMLDGTYCELGSQIVAVFFGYIIGLMGAACGFQFGRQCGLWLHNFRHPGDEQNEQSPRNEDMEILTLYGEPNAHTHRGVELVDDDEVCLRPVPNHLHKIPLFVVAVGLLVSFVVAMRQGIAFYKGMTLLWILSPVGSLLRWSLTGLNTKDGKVFCFNLPAWIPWGTFCANMLAVVLSACLTGIDYRYFANGDMEGGWVKALLFALTAGFAGSLSTVSTFISETAILYETHGGLAKPHFYATATCLCGMILGLIVYAMTVRISA